MNTGNSHSAGDGKRSSQTENQQLSAYDYFSLGHPLTSLRTYFASRARKRMFDLFMEWARPEADDLILDLGVTPDESLAESNFFERLYPYPDRITAASIEDASNLERIFPGVRFQMIRPGPLPFKNKSFKFLFCSAVIEHVGDRESQRKFVDEIARVSHRFFITTPNRWFPIEFHTIFPIIHWFPTKIHHAILRSVGMTRWADINLLNLLSASEILKICPPECKVDLKRVRLAGITSNLVLMGSS